MEAFYLKVYLFRSNDRVPPIKIARNSQLPIVVELMDYAIPAGSKASAFASGSSGKIYTQPCTVDENRVIFTPQIGFLVPGRNSLQYLINDGVIPLAIDVYCDVSLPDGGEAVTPEEVLPYVTRAENAAKAAEGNGEKAELYAGKAAASLETVLQKEASARSAAESAAQSLIGANAARDDSQRYSNEAKDFANTAAGYAGAATVSIGWDADGYFSIFEQEE